MYIYIPSPIICSKRFSCTKTSHPKISLSGLQRAVLRRVHKEFLQLFHVHLRCSALWLDSSGKKM